MAIKIKAASTRLLDELYEIEKKCFAQEAFTKQQLACLLTDYNAIGLVVRVSGVIAGFTIARVGIKRNASFGHILTVDIEPVHHRKGIAQKLLHEVENILREKGMKEWRLEVREDNVATLSLYKRLGLKKAGKIEKLYVDTHGFYLQKTLH